MSIRIGGVQKFSLLDFPDKISAIIFTSGCNFHCGYCHNPELFDTKSFEWNEDSVLEFLATRKGKLDGVVITGGEPTIQKNLKEFITKIKKLSFLVKLDTNGTNPKLLNDLINSNLIDYVAMDIKAPLEKYSFVTQVEANTKDIKTSINILLKNKIPYEFRTTSLSSQLSIEDFESIGELIKGAEKYFIQKFIPSKILDETLLSDKGYTNDEIKVIIRVLQKYIRLISVR